MLELLIEAVWPNVCRWLRFDSAPGGTLVWSEAENMCPDEATARSRSASPGGALPDAVKWKIEEDHARIARHMHARKLGRDTAALATRAYRGVLVYTSTQTQTRVAVCSSMFKWIEN